MTERYAWIGQKATDEEEDDAIAFYVARVQGSAEQYRSTASHAKRGHRTLGALPSPERHGLRLDVLAVYLGIAFGVSVFWAGVAAFIRWLVGG